MEVPASVDSPKAESKFLSASETGRRLHECLEEYLISRITYKKTDQQAYQDALSRSKSLGVFPQFCAMHKPYMDQVAAMADPVHASLRTELSLIMGPDMNCREGSYDDVKEGDLCVGTLDFAFQCRDGTILLGDWKTGYDDVDVPEENEQLMALAFMLKSTMKVVGHKIRLGIYNPVVPCNSTSDAFSHFYMNRDLLVSVNKETENAGDWCRYCPLKINCESFSDMCSEELKAHDMKDLYDFQDD